MKQLLLVIVLMITAIPAVAQDAGWIGVTVDDQKDPGAIIRRVDPNGPAAKAGLREGDVIIEFNKQDVAGVLQLSRLVRETPVGRTVEVKVRRDNRDQTFQVTTERFTGFGGSFQLNVPDASVLTDQIMRRIPDIQIMTSFSQSGIRVQRLTDQLRDFFGVSRDEGVLVTFVDSGSAAEKAGIKAGDIIIAINGQVVRNPADFSRAMSFSGPQIALKIVREKTQREITLERTSR
jgi:serine protease Do